jgi:hypothetical protein
MWNHPNKRLTFSLSPWVRPNLSNNNSHWLGNLPAYGFYGAYITSSWFAPAITQFEAVEWLLCGWWQSPTPLFSHSRGIVRGDSFLILYYCTNSWLCKWWGSCRRCAVVWYKFYRLHPRCQCRCDALIDNSMPTSKRDLKPFEAGWGKPCSLSLGLLLSGYKRCKPLCVCSMRKGNQHQEGWCWAFAWSRLSLQSRRANNWTSDCILINRDKETTKTKMKFVEYCECYFSEEEASFLCNSGDMWWWDFAPHLFTGTGDVRESTLGGVLIQVCKLLWASNKLTNAVALCGTALWALTTENGSLLHSVTVQMYRMSNWSENWKRE